MNKSLLGASLVALALVAPAAHAHQPGDFIVRAGAITTALASLLALLTAAPHAESHTEELPS